MKFLRRFLLAVVIALALLLALAWTAPAELAYRIFAAHLGPLRAEGISGSVWQGRAEQLSAYGQPLGALQWQIEKMALVHGGAEGSFRLGGDGILGQGELKGQGRDFSIANLRGNFPARLLGPALDIPALNLLGEVQFDVALLRLHDGYIADAQGVASWRDIAVGGITAAALPGVQARFSTAADGDVVGEIADLGGPLEIAGTVRMHQERYQTVVRLKVREPSPQLEEVLKFIGERTPDGGSLLRVEGQIKRLY